MSGAAAWADALQALALFAADPIGLGGISIRAGAGPVRDRFMTLLLAALPAGMKVRRLPLHAGDDRLLGGLDLAATLQAGRPVAQAGLLAEADGGVLILAMAERIEPNTASRLGAAMDDGVVVLQRDGLSRILPARFGMVALDEGLEPDERPPAGLLDRMAFHVDLTEVSLRDSALDEEPDRSMVNGLSVDSAPADDGMAILCQTAMALGIESARAALFAWRAAVGAATGAGREQVAEADLALAARLVLAPRACRFPAPEQAEEQQEAPPPPEPDQEVEQELLPDQKLEDIVLEAVKAALPADLLTQLAQADGGRGTVRTPGRAGQVQASVRRGRPVGTRPGEPKNGARLHVLETLKAAAPWQTLRGRGDRLQVRRDDLRIVRFRQRVGTTTVFAVDASGSAAMHRLAEAKGAVELLLADCYIRRDQVALIAFRGTDASLLLPPTGSLLRAKRSLAGLPGGGPTPLAAGIEAAMTLAETVRRGGRTPVITLLTDARANIARDGSGGRSRAEAEALEAARLLAARGVATLLVDTSPRPNPFACRLAADMRARYVPLPYADASALSRAVRSASAA
jgi:magnesium chelatase subunit D